MITAQSQLLHKTSLNLVFHRNFAWINWLGYVTFVQSIIDNYKPYNSNLQVFLACGPMISDPCCTYVQNVVDTLNQSNNGIAHFIDMQNILSYPDDYGCSGHPNVIGDQKMAKIAIPIIQQVMEWW